jgi:hypothetical protein
MSTSHELERVVTLHGGERVSLHAGAGSVRAGQPHRTGKS